MISKRKKNIRNILNKLRIYIGILGLVMVLIETLLLILGHSQGGLSGGIFLFGGLFLWTICRPDIKEGWF